MRVVFLPRDIILLAVLALCFGAQPVYAADDAAGNKKELQRIKREMQEKKRELKRADRKERSVLAEIERLDRDIQAGSAELAESQRRLREAEAGLQAVEKGSAELSRDLVRVRERYRQRVRALYKMGHSGYAVDALAADNLSGALKRAKYLGMIAEQDRAIINGYREALDGLLLKQAQIKEGREEVLRRKEAVGAKKVELSSRRQKKTVILASVKREKGLYEQSLRELEESSSSLWAMIKKAGQEKKAAKEKQRPSGPQAPATSAPRKNQLPWPVDGQALTRFGAQRHPEFGTAVFRRGIEIEARQGETVRAVGDGQAAYADWYKGYGRLVIIDHGAGLYTLYGNLSHVDVNADDRVVRGQVIGRAGDTGSLKGPKLYFEVRQGGEAQDPLLWLARK